MNDANGDWDDGLTSADDLADASTLNAQTQAAGQGGTPSVTVAGFDGPLDTLLTLARARQIELADVGLLALLEQLAVALRQAPPATSLGEKASWVVMAAWLLELRSRLLLPPDAPAQIAAQAEADQLRQELLRLQQAQALAAWLGQRPQLGQDVFARGRPEVFGVTVDAPPPIDVVEFLWASLMLFDDDLPGADTTPVYHPPWHQAVYRVADARARILQRLAEQPNGMPMNQLLPDPEPLSLSMSKLVLRQRSAWSSTFMASLELSRLGEVVLGQTDYQSSIHVQAAEDASEKPSDHRAAYAKNGLTRADAAATHSCLLQTRTSG